MSLDTETMAGALPGYEIGAEIGRGAWGVVFEGTHRQLGRKVAIKQLPRQFGADEQVRARFLSEARLLAALDHPHIVPIFDYVELDGLCLLVMEWLPGGTVWDRFSSKGIVPESACATVLAACAGLHFAHERGVLHRDVKPENLIFNAEGALKVSDFGIAKVITGADAGATRAGEVLGTPAYMAPEQAQGGDVGPYTDVYAVGTMLYELLSGQLPFPEGNDPLALMFQHVYEQPIPLSQVAPQLGPELEAVTMRSIATSPSERFATAEEMGVAVAEAAALAWGPGWLTRADLRLMAGGPIAAAAERPTVQSGSPTRPPAAPVASIVAVVRPTMFRPEGISALDRKPEDVVPLAQVVKLPPKPIVHIGAAVVLLVVSALIALAAVGKAKPAGDLHPGVVQIAGRDPVSSGVVALDLGKPVPIALSQIPEGADKVTLRLSVLGVALSSAQSDLKKSGAAAGASLDAGRAKFLVPSDFTGELRLTAGGRLVASRTFTASSAQPSYITAPAAAAVVLGLFVFAYAEALLRPMRRGRKVLTGMTGVTAMGLLGGVAIVLAVWVLASRQPTVASTVGSAVGGAGAGVAAGLAAIRVGKRRRLRRRKTPLKPVTGEG